MHICFCLQVSGTGLNDQVPWGNGTFGEALLAPTIIYVQRLLSLVDVADVKVCLSDNMPPHQSMCLEVSCVNIEMRTMECTTTCEGCKVCMS